jgi:N-acetylglutamate synthase-like GNAT family acetyltransferase
MSEIRIACATDLDAAGALADGCFGPIGGRSLRYCHGAAPQLTFCCEAAGGIVGVCFGYPSSTEEATAILDCLAVAHTGRGIGTRLLTHFEKAAREADHASVQLGAEEGEPSRFYLRRGYQTLTAAPAHAPGHVILSKVLLLST